MHKSVKPLLLLILLLLPLEDVPARPHSARLLSQWAVVCACARARARFLYHGMHFPNRWHRRSKILGLSG